MAEPDRTIRKIDEYTTVTVGLRPSRAKTDDPLANGPDGLSCGHCGSKETDLVFWQSGGLADRTVDLREVKCRSCVHYTLYDYRDPL